MAQRSVVSCIESILNKAEQRRDNIYIRRCGGGRRCNICSNHTYKAYNIYVGDRMWRSPHELEFVPGVACLADISYLRVSCNWQLRHILEMYKVIRCIDPDVAKYMLKFVYLPLIVDT
jgi:hypothetical protein